MAEYISSSQEAVTQNVMSKLISCALFTLDTKTPSDSGTDYKPLYYGLFSGITSIILNAHTYEETITALKQLQCMAEDAYINQGEL